LTVISPRSFGQSISGRKKKSSACSRRQSLRSFAALLRRKKGKKGAENRKRAINFLLGVTIEKRRGGKKGIVLGSHPLSSAHAKNKSSRRKEGRGAGIDGG